MSTQRADLRRPDPSRVSHASASRHVEHVLSLRRIPFTFEPNFSIDMVREVEGTQVRLSVHRAPREMVTRFAAQMRAGAIFPAIVVNDRGDLVDGNTRCAAARRNRYEHIAAYICSDLSPLQARALSVELNQSHGLGMTEEELRAFVLSAVQEGHSFDTRSYARMTGVTASKLSKWVACARFHIRAQRCGIPQADVALLSESKQATLNAARLRCVFMEATLLAVAARLPVAQLKRLVAAANDAPSEAEALAIVAGERQAREEEIAAVARGFTSGLRRRTRPASMHVAALLKTDADKLLDVMPEAHSETFEALSALQRHIAAVLAEAARRWGMPTASSGGSPTVASGVPAHA